MSRYMNVPVSTLDTAMSVVWAAKRDTWEDLRNEWPPFAWATVPEGFWHQVYGVTDTDDPGIVTISVDHYKRLMQWSKDALEYIELEDPSHNGLAAVGLRDRAREHVKTHRADVYYGSNK